MNKERLIELKSVLENVPERKFDMDSWITSDYSCEAVACALGWAAMHPPFNAQGLRIDRTNYHVCHPPVFGDWVGYAAAEFFFDIPETASRWLFDPDKYERDLYHDEEGNWKVTPADVIARIDQLLADLYRDNPIRRRTMSESTPMNTPSEEQQTTQSIHHYFDPREVQLTMRQTALIQARELTGAMAVYIAAEINEFDMVKIARITLDIAQMFEHYLTSGEALHEDQ